MVTPQTTTLFICDVAVRMNLILTVISLVWMVSGAARAMPGIVLCAGSLAARGSLARLVYIRRT